MLIFGAVLVVNESAFHAGAILLLNVNFLTLVLFNSIYNLKSVFVVMSDLVKKKKKIQIINLMNSFIHLD